MENNFVYGVHMHNLSIYGRNAWKRKRKSKKLCLLKKLLFFLLFKKYYLKHKIIKTNRISFFVFKICQAWCSQFWRFLVKKVFFWLIGHQSSPKKSPLCNLLNHIRISSFEQLGPWSSIFFVFFCIFYFFLFIFIFFLLIHNRYTLSILWYLGSW